MSLSFTSKINGLTLQLRAIVQLGSIKGKYRTIIGLTSSSYAHMETFLFVKVVGKIDPTQRRADYNSKTFTTLFKTNNQ